jgi:phosphoglucosamine mutase
MFGTSGIRGPVGETITAEVALSIGRAVGARADSVILGRDARDSGRALCDGLAAGLVESGTDIIDLGMVATPTAARAVGARDADAGIVVTASHNPPQDNGIKLWSPSGQAFDADQRAAIERRVTDADYDLAAWDGHGDRTTWAEAEAAHREALVAAGERWFDAVGAAPEELSVVVDPGAGTGGLTADALYELGVSVETLNAQPDGRFPARPSEPTASNCESLCRCVDALDADLGIAHDGDADRMLAVDDTGTFVSGDLLLAVFAREAADRGDIVAAPVNTSLVVSDALESVGATLEYTRVGDVYVADRASDDGVVFGGEPSGAWIFPTETLCPDGPLAAVRLAALAAAEPLSTRLDAFDPYPIHRTAIETDTKAAVMEHVATACRETIGADATLTTRDGVRVTRGEGWYLIRASGTQPLVRVTAEARDDATAAALLETAEALVSDAIERADESARS